MGADTYEIEALVGRCELGEDLLAIIGRDVLRWCRLAYDGLKGTFTLHTFPDAMGVS